MTLWCDAGVFEINETPIAVLERCAHSTDYAVLIFAADDKVETRNRVVWKARDNVVLELGLFAGRNGDTILNSACASRVLSSQFAVRSHPIPDF